MTFRTKRKLSTQCCTRHPPPTTSARASSVVDGVEAGLTTLAPVTETYGEGKAVKRSDGATSMVQDDGATTAVPVTPEALATEVTRGTGVRGPDGMTVAELAAAEATGIDSDGETSVPLATPVAPTTWLTGGAGTLCPGSVTRTEGGGRTTAVHGTHVTLATP